MFVVVWLFLLCVACCVMISECYLCFLVLVRVYVCCLCCDVVFLLFVCVVTAACVVAFFRAVCLPLSFVCCVGCFCLCLWSLCLLVLLFVLSYASVVCVRFAVCVVGCALSLLCSVAGCIIAGWRCLRCRYCVSCLVFRVRFFLLLCFVLSVPCL